MDAIVFRAMAKWPEVPAVYGWLTLDRRGRWRLRGEILEHPAMVRFINRNYACDDRGCWYFQNGPQRVYVTLDYAPFVFSLDARARLLTHTGVRVRRLQGAAIDDEGNLLLLCEHGPGVFDDRDLLAASRGFVDEDGRPCEGDALERAIEDPVLLRRTRLSFRWQDMCARIESVPRAQAPRRFGFVAQPAHSE